MTITAKVKLLCDDGDTAALLLDTTKAYSDACNFVSDFVFRTHCLKHSSLNTSLYRTLRDRFGLRSQMAQSVLKTVVSKYQTIHTNQKEWIRPSFRLPQYDLVWNRDYSLHENCFSLNTLQGRVKIPYESKGTQRWFTECARFGTAKLVYRHSAFFLHIPVTFPLEHPFSVSESSMVVGIDRGVNFIANTYDSHGKAVFYSGKEVKQKRAHYRNKRRELQKRKTASARRRLKRIGQRENRWMSDMNHRISKALTESYPVNTVFVLEDLKGIRSATERVHLKHRYVMVSWSFYDLEQKLTYKAAMHGQKVIKVDPRYTSQRCPICGHTEKSNRDRKLHMFECRRCGYRSNDDRIGAMNLYQSGIAFVEAKAAVGMAEVQDTVLPGHIPDSKAAVNQPVMQRQQMSE